VCFLSDERDKVTERSWVKDGRDIGKFSRKAPTTQLSVEKREGVQGKRKEEKEGGRRFEANETGKYPWLCMGSHYGGAARWKKKKRREKYGSR